jgi:plastocyanin
MPESGRRRLIRLLATGFGALTLSASGLACGGSSSPSSTSIEAYDFGFRPSSEAVKVGDAVTWTNTGQTTHTVKGPGFFSKAITPGQGYSFTFKNPGTYRYICTLHPTLMRGTIVVGA